MDEGRLVDPERLRTLRATGLLDVRSAPSLDRLTDLAARLVGAPVALVSLVDEDRQVFTSGHGLTGDLARDRQTPLSHSYCQYVVTDGAPLIIDDARLDDRLHDNPSIAEHQVIAYAGSPLRAPNGQVLGSFCMIDTQPRKWTEEDLAILRDLSAAAEAEIELRLFSERLRAVLDGSHDAFVSITDDGTITTWNTAAERLFGWSRAEAQGRFIGDLIVPPQLRENYERGLAGARRNGTLQADRMESTAVDRAGREIPVELSVQVSVEHGQRYYHAFIRDITDRVNARRQREVVAAQRERLLEHERQEVAHLRELDRLKDELVALVSHELKNPIAVIRGYTGMLVRDPALSETHRRYAEAIDEAGDHLLQLLNDLLDLARIDAGLVAIKPTEVAADALIADCVRAHEPTATEQKVTIGTDVPAGLTVYADKGRLRQVIDNLLSNAVKYTPGGGTVTITAEAGDPVSLTVADTGIGIPLEQYPQLFTRFFRASTAVRHGISGTGLGLAITRAIVDAHHGTIAAEPAEPTGTRFTVTLPAAPPAT